MRIARVAAAFGVAVVLASCATTQKSVGVWFATATPTPTPAPKAKAAQAPRAYYAGVEGLKVYAAPSSSSNVIGTLSLHEKVIRSNVERGYALVESTKSGIKGWVDNAQLTWRLAPAPKTAGPAPEEAPPEEAPPEEAPPEEAPPEEPAAPTEEEQAPPPPEATATAIEPQPATPVPTASPVSKPTPRGVGPSIFNPY
jgi:hypothetical protein